MSLPLEKMIQALNSIPVKDREKIINNVPWLKRRLVELIQKDLISMKPETIFDEITKTREFIFSKHGKMPDCIDYIREDRLR